MCGIVGYVGKKNSKEILLSGLKELEYRGYDSAGIAVLENSNFSIFKAVGKLVNLEEKTNGILIKSENFQALKFLEPKYRKQIKTIYIDPPYNSRQYANMYHLLENLALWQKPEVKGVAKKFDTTHLKSGYNQKEAVKFFEDLIKNAKAKYILFSYNNMGSKGHTRSNARISDDDIFRILSKKGRVKVYEKEYRDFRSGKSKRDNVERVFFVGVK